MTRQRIYGEDKPMCDWIRRHSELDSDKGIVVTDCDLIIHRYLTICDRYGLNGTISTREIQAMMMVEVKTRLGKPSDSQSDTLAKWNLFRGSKAFENYSIRNLGVSILSLSGTNPDDSETMFWGRFLEDQKAQEIKWRKISKEELTGLLLFNLHPDNLTTNPFRRHHAKKEIFTEETTENGLQIPVRVFQRS